jgi:hypothetical protein
VSLPQPPTPPPVPRYLKKKTDFSVLATNPKFQDLLKTYPALLPTLQRVYATTIEPDPEDRRMGRGGFRGRGMRGRGRGRGRGGFNDDREGRWNQKKGDADALKMLKGLRDGKSGDKEKEGMVAFGRCLGRRRRDEGIDRDAKITYARVEGKDASAPMEHMIEKTSNLAFETLAVQLEY